MYADEWAFYPLIIAGGHRSGHTLLSHLSKRSDVDCMALIEKKGRGVPSEAYYPRLTDFEALGIREFRIEDGKWRFDCGYPVWAVDHVRQALRGFLDSFQPAVIYCHTPESLAMIRQAHERGVGGLWYLRDTRPRPEDIRAAVEMGTQTVCCSKFLQRWYTEHCGIEPKVIYPFIDQADYRVASNSRAYITFINPHPLKGLETFLQIAPLFPDQPFLVVESWPLGADYEQITGQLAQFPNVRFINRVSDVRDIYGQTRLLIVPSICEDAAPRVVIEAHANGIPVIASNRGGIAEMMGEGGIMIEDYLSAAAWAEAIRRLCDNPAEMARFSRAALDNARREDLSADFITGEFLAVCERASRKARAV